MDAQEAGLIQPIYLFAKAKGPHLPHRQVQLLRGGVSEQRAGRYCVGFGKLGRQFRVRGIELF